MSELRKKIEEAVKTENIILPLDPGKIADEYLARTYDTGTFFPGLIRHQGVYYQWTGTHYNEWSDEAADAGIINFLRQAKIRSSTVGADGVSREVLKPFPIESKRIDLIKRVLRAQVLIPDRLEAPCWRPGGLGELLYPASEFLVCHNGALHLPTRKLHPHSAELLSFNALPYDYDPGAADPVEWLKFLRSIWPDGRESIDCLQEIFGYMLGGDLSMQKIFMLIGVIRSGKGTIGRILGRLVGKHNVAGPTIEELGQHFGMECLIGKQVAIVGDARVAGETSNLVSRLLSISGEDTIEIPRKGRKSWSGKLATRFMVMSNLPPRLTDGSAAIINRVVALHFSRSFAKNPDRGLEKRCAEELPGILLWALAGLDRLQERGCFMQPESGKAEIEKMLALASPLRSFADEHCEFGADYVVVEQDFYGEWRDWCHRVGHHPGALNKLSADLTVQFPSVRSGVRPRVNGNRGRGALPG
jgi:putative DNA primase/helicase